MSNTIRATSKEGDQQFYAVRDGHHWVLWDEKSPDHPLPKDLLPHYPNRASVIGALVRSGAEVHGSWSLEDVISFNKGGHILMWAAENPAQYRAASAIRMQHGLTEGQWSAVAVVNDWTGVKRPMMLSSANTRKVAAVLGIYELCRRLK